MSMTFFKVFNIFNISGSGLSAQRKNLEVRAENIANAESVDMETGQPYQAKNVNFTSRNEKDFFKNIYNKTRLTLKQTSFYHFNNFDRHTNSDNAPKAVNAEVYVPDQDTKLIYDPAHPHADENGYVEMPNINSIDEMTKMMSAARAYEANTAVLDAAKDMFKKALEI
jgi:flagellar basal-body rod protein FlgC